jgi:hypothetical protein
MIFKLYSGLRSAAQLAASRAVRPNKAFNATAPPPAGPRVNSGVGPRNITAFKWSSSGLTAVSITPYSSLLWLQAASDFQACRRCSWHRSTVGSGNTFRGVRRDLQAQFQLAQCGSARGVKFTAAQQGVQRDGP